MFQWQHKKPDAGISDGEQDWKQQKMLLLTCWTIEDGS